MLATGQRSAVRAAEAPKKGEGPVEQKPGNACNDNSRRAMYMYIYIYILFCYLLLYNIYIYIHAQNMYS